MPRTVLITGASGLVGTAAVDSFLNAGWDVVAVSRRRPEVFSERPFTHLPVDLQDAAACQAAFGRLPQVSHVVYAAVYEKPTLIAGWRDPEQMATNLAMIKNVIEPLARTAHLRHVTLLQGTKAYGVHLHPIRIPAREREPRDDHPNSYWFQEDYIREQAGQHGFGWTIFRPAIVLGPNVGVAMNTIPVIGVYAALCREEGRAFSYPGHIPYPREAVDARLIGDAAVWAAGNPRAWGEHYNLTNGEVFSWRDLWPGLAALLQVEPGPDQPLCLAEYLPSRATLWAQIVKKHGLRPLGMEELLGQSHYSADARFGYGLRAAPAPAFVSTVKIKQAGFTQVYDTEECVHHWLRVLADRKIIPAPGA
ncbi:SDR family oxidoreductase [Bordetella genomosp. 2]|uniref:Short-chain dehydrogenase n=1 Tax=Bordetella genomosp. 2 TaxID=1983456 RepID=A0A261VGQ0_9BORD|nr:SDR family oxidoreductase [Bordetella genomosp. 2]OZI72692.1 short-chain dehydrogenase [Bordetella genomosp. 2]